MLKIKDNLLILCCFLGSNCFVFATKAADVKAISQQYFATYAERSDFARFMAFYHQDIVFEDMIYGNYIANKAELAKFLDWSKGDFSIVDNGSLSKPLTLVIKRQVINGNSVITEGHFNRFNYSQQQLGPWRFVIWLEFSPQGKIIHQQDWINYTPRQQFLGGQNMNQLINGASH